MVERRYKVMPSWVFIYKYIKDNVETHPNFHTTMTDLFRSSNYSMEFVRKGIDFLDVMKVITVDNSGKEKVIKVSKTFFDYEKCFMDIHDFYNYMVYGVNKDLKFTDVKR